MQVLKRNAEEQVRTHSSAAGDTKRPKVPSRKQFLEVELQPQLHDARIPGRGELPEIAGPEVVADIMELSVVEGVKGFHAEFQTAAACFAEYKALEEREVPIVAALSSRCVVGQIAEGAQGWKRKGRRQEHRSTGRFAAC